ncbi:MAG: hypothetical protein COT81_00160 [Candidatus Buchananbacteria bacterium CG10_big_fil_rev_8_21_14_0_10_42_9]|uniref:Uncharacterized protein n=1 Tax=Candidatus Buchananbacteria bacterium CG10_big_fil_rev_8_21_14_0_10_42_9 TaxID=1974526 RepID=A0A2H0W2P3_9BACT|nr:MAG: hypothetical protein COT81_00160 [Candidatus Buchananbacteria bacterium CG10_big_fil_rev_8_21_14_0_10_42_9]
MFDLERFLAPDDTPDELVRSLCERDPFKILVIGDEAGLMTEVIGCILDESVQVPPNIGAFLLQRHDCGLDMFRGYSLAKLEHIGAMTCNMVIVVTQSEVATWVSYWRLKLSPITTLVVTDDKLNRELKESVSWLPAEFDPAALRALLDEATCFVCAPAAVAN